MQFLLRLSRAIDAVNTRVGRLLGWLVLAMVLVSTANAFGRKFFHASSNAWLEIQWYLFGALFLLTAGYALLRNDHVRVDVLAQKLSHRAQVRMEIFGILVFLLPGCLLIMWLAWPMFWESYVSGEMSSNSGGLIRWPAKLLVPVGFTLLIAAAISHLIKCVGFLRGLCPDPREREKTDDEAKLAAEIAERLNQSGVPEASVAAATQPPQSDTHPPSKAN